MTVPGLLKLMARKIIDKINEPLVKYDGSENHREVHCMYLIILYGKKVH